MKTINRKKVEETFSNLLYGKALSRKIHFRVTYSLPEEEYNKIITELYIKLINQQKHGETI